MPPRLAIMQSMLAPGAICGPIRLGKELLNDQDLSMVASWGISPPYSLPDTYWECPANNITNGLYKFNAGISEIHFPYYPHLSPDQALSFVDDIGLKGPKTWYNNLPIPGIRCFVWEYAHSLHQESVTNGSDPRGTHNADSGRCLNGVGLVRTYREQGGNRGRDPSQCW